MILKIQAPLKPVTLNHSKGIRVIRKFAQVYTTVKAKAFKTALNGFLLKHAVQIDLFLQAFHRLNNPCLVASYEISDPSFLTKAGKINKRGGDWTNLVKFAEDCIFDYLKIDDALIMFSCVEKIQGETNFIVELECMEYDDYLKRRGEAWSGL